MPSLDRNALRSECVNSWQHPSPLQSSSIVLFEWLRGPRLKEEIEAQEMMFPGTEVVPFAAVEAELAAEIYKTVNRPRGRKADIAIAACALVYGANLWALNKGDFKDIPGLQLLP